MFDIKPFDLIAFLIIVFIVFGAIAITFWEIAQYIYSHISWQ